MYGNADYMNPFDWGTVYEDTIIAPAPDTTSTTCTHILLKFYIHNLHARR